MMRPVLAAATRRGWLAGAGAALLVLSASACTPPPHASAVQCSSSNIADVAVKKICTVTITKFAKQALTRRQGETRRPTASFTGRVTLTPGNVRDYLRANH